MSEPIPRILIYRLRYLGDVILTTPILQAIRMHYPAAHLTLATDAAYVPLFATHPALDAVLPVTSQSLKSWPGRREWVGRLRAGQYSCALNLARSLSSALYLALAGIPKRVGFATNGHALLQTSSVPYSPVAFEPACFAAVAQAAGISVDTLMPVLTVTPEAQARAELLLPEAGYVAVHVGCSHPAKTWPAAYFARVLTEVQAWGARPVLVGGPSEQAYAAEILQQCPVPIPSLVGTLDLPTLLAILARARLFLGVDSGPAHLARAAGVRGVVLFGPTVPEKWGHPENINLSGHIACSPCYPWKCQTPTCMTAVSPESVLAAMQHLLIPMTSGGHDGLLSCAGRQG